MLPTTFSLGLFQAVRLGKVRQAARRSALAIFDSDSFSLTSADLNSIFRDGANISFGSTEDTGNSIVHTNFGYNRDNTSVLTASITGTNSGKISIEYYAVPEPETWALLAFSLTTVMVMRRRRR